MYMRNFSLSYSEVQETGFKHSYIDLNGLWIVQLHYSYYPHDEMNTTR